MFWSSHTLPGAPVSLCIHTLHFTQRECACTYPNFRQSYDPLHFKQFFLRFLRVVWSTRFRDRGRSDRHIGRDFFTDRRTTFHLRHVPIHTVSWQEARHIFSLGVYRFNSKEAMVHRLINWIHKMNLLQFFYFIWKIILNSNKEVIFDVKSLILKRITPSSNSGFVRPPTILHIQRNTHFMLITYFLKINKLLNGIQFDISLAISICFLKSA